MRSVVLPGVFGRRSHSKPDLGSVAGRSVPFVSSPARHSGATEILSREDLPDLHGSPRRAGLAVGEITAGLLTVSGRLLELLDTPEDIPFLSPLIQREIAYRILRSPQGERLRAVRDARRSEQ